MWPALWWLRWWAWGMETMLTSLQMPDDERARWHRLFSPCELTLLEVVRATAWAREFGLPGYTRLEYVKWLYQHGRLNEQVE